MTHMNRSLRQIPIYLIAAIMVALVGSLVIAQDGAAPAAGNDGAAPAAQIDGAAASEDGDGGSKGDETSFLGLLMKGGWFMVPIGACSLLGLTIIIERLVSLRRSAIIPPAFMDGLAAVFRNPEKDRDAALHYCHANECPISRVVAVGIRKIPQGPESVEQGIEDAGSNEVAKLRRNLRMLYGVSAITPMIGLLGTVWGMIEAFREVASVSGLGQAELLAQGIYTALVTTFAGLTVAIPVLVAYYYFLSKIDMIVSEMNDVSEHFIETHISGEALQPSAQNNTNNTDLPAGAAPAAG